MRTIILILILTSAIFAESNLYSHAVRTEHGYGNLLALLSGDNMGAAALYVSGKSNGIVTRNKKLMVETKIERTFLFGVTHELFHTVNIVYLIGGTSVKSNLRGTGGDYYNGFTYGLAILETIPVVPFSASFGIYRNNYHSRLFGSVGFNFNL